MYRVKLMVENPHFAQIRITWLSRLVGAMTAEVRVYVKEIEHDKEFLDDVRSAYKRNTYYFPLPTDFMVTSTGNTMFFHCVSLYALTRLLRPTSIVETGGTPGKSSAFILRGLERNRTGHLYTIDLPPPQSPKLPVPSKATRFRPPNVGANWCVPNYLRHRQTLLLGSAQEQLPSLLVQLGEICMFIHDSDHSYGHMLWELETSYPFVKREGLIMADDIGTNSAWLDFCASHELVRQDFTSQGAARKNS